MLFASKSYALWGRSAATAAGKRILFSRAKEPDPNWIRRRKPADGFDGFTAVGGHADNPNVGHLLGQVMQRFVPDKMPSHLRFLDCKGSGLLLDFD
jgi:hypothetical protein